MSSKNVVEYRKRVKLSLVKAFGERCQICKEKHEPFVFDFHHLNPNEKEFGIASANTTRAKNKVANEAKKCIMVCANCHRYIEHGNLVVDCESSFNEKAYFDVLDDLANKSREAILTFKLDLVRERKDQGLPLYPTIEEYRYAVESGDYKSVAERYGIKEITIKRWSHRGLPKAMQRQHESEKV